MRRDFAVLGAGSLGIMLAQLAFRSILIVAIVPSAYGRLSLVLAIYNTVMFIGVSGLPDTASRYIAVNGPASDGAIVRATLRAAFWPTAAASIAVGVSSAVILQNAWAGLFGMVGLAGMVFSLISLGILRGRGRVFAAASIMPAAAATEVILLAGLWKSDLGVTPLFAFGFFCLGNVLSSALAIFSLVRTKPRGVDPEAAAVAARPSSRELLGFSIWLTLATISIVAMPLVMRFAAAFDSYAVVATVDISLVLLSVPQRVGAVIVSAVIPHASRDAAGGEIGLTITLREHLYLVVPFAAAAAALAFTPVVGTIFDAIGRPAYSSSATYLALALLASPARVLYGLVQGVLTAHGQGPFLARNALTVTLAASALIATSAALGSIAAAFAVFVAACWIVYLAGLRRIHQLSAAAAGSPARPGSPAVAHA